MFFPGVIERGYFYIKCGRNVIVAFFFIVVLKQLYISGGLSFGAIVTGLSVNAGLGLMVLLKENKNKKENLFIILMLIIPSLIFGYMLHFLPLNFLNI